MVESLGHWVEKLKDTKFICIGDVMLDRFVWGEVNRICPEAPIPVIRVRKEQEMLGGAGNVVRNLDALGATGDLLSVIGDDLAGQRMSELIDELENSRSHFCKVSDRPTTIKVRYIASGQQLLRADTEEHHSIAPIHEDEINDQFKQILNGQNVVILSDYGKGVLTHDLCQSLISTAKSAGKIVVADPKGRDFAKYSGVDILTPNKGELAFATGLPIDSDANVEVAAKCIMDAHNIKVVIVTRSSEGMSVITAEESTHIPTVAKEVFDVSGAGDTVVSTIAAALAVGAPLVEAAKLANVAAGIVVAKLGTAVVHQSELLEEVHHQEIKKSESSIVSFEQAASMTRLWQKQNKKVVFTNGCFDLLHPGHLALLTQARAAGHRLVIGLNTDSSIKRLKGEDRPIQSEMARAVVLSSLELVDLVVLFDEDTPLKLIETLKPDVLVKGADYTIDKVVGADFVQSYGGKVVLAELKPGQSTTNTVNKMLKIA